MRSLLVFSLPLALATGCAQGPRTVAGQAESGTTQLLAIDTAGDAFQVAPNADLTFALELPTTRPVHLFQLKGDTVQVVRFAEKLDGPKVASSMPNHEGTVSLGKLSTASDDPSAAEAEQSPLEQIDSDDDGENDCEDDDDDGDGQDDAEDDDDDGEDGPDSDDDLDTDDDGSPDLCDDDDDDDGVGDENDDEDDDADDDGVRDDDDEDDDNDGEDDGEDDDDDDDGVSDDDELEDGPESDGSEDGADDGSDDGSDDGTP